MTIPADLSSPPMLAYEPPREDWLRDDERCRAIFFNVGMVYLLAEIFSRAVQEIEKHFLVNGGGFISAVAEGIYALPIFGFFVALIMLVLFRFRWMSLAVVKYGIAVMLLCASIEFIYQLVPRIMPFIVHPGKQDAFAVATAVQLIAYRFARMVPSIMLMLAAMCRFPPRRVITLCVTILASAMSISFVGMIFPWLANKRPNIDARDFWYVCMQAMFVPAAVISIFAFRGTRPNAKRATAIPVAILIVVGCAGLMIWSSGVPVRSLREVFDLGQVIAFFVRDSTTAIALLVLTTKAPLVDEPFAHPS